MAFYALLAKDRKTERWRTCAVFPAGSKQSAIAQAKSLRESNALGFVPFPTKFKMRGASRREMSLLTAYLNSVDNTHIETFRQEELEGFLRRRRKLMLSFFLGLFVDPDAMKRRLSGATGGKPITLKNTTTGGVENEMSSGEPTVEAETETSETSNEVSSETASEETAQDAIDDTQSGDDASPAVDSDALTDASEQEAALAALLSSDDAKPSKDGDEVDLDFL